MKKVKTRFIELELRQFKRKYWLTKLLQGLLVFAGTGLVFFALVSLIEYFSWLSSAQRTGLFTLTAIVELALFAYYLGWPSLQLAINGRALSDRKAADIIGAKLTGLDDKLTNYLELRESSSHSDLIDAGIQQKQSQLSIFTFKEAIKFSSLKPFLLFLLPLAVLLLFVWSGNRWFMLSEGAERLVNFNMEFQRKWPFEIAFENSLETDEGKDFDLSILVEGDLLPEELLIESDYGKRVMSRVNGNEYKTTFKNCSRDIPFSIVYEDIKSEQYVLHVNKKAVVGRVGIRVIPPKYTGISEFKVENSKDVEVPQNSFVELSYVFKNAEKLALYQSYSLRTDTSSLLPGDTHELHPTENTKIVVVYNDEELSRTDINVIKDKRPVLEILVDSLESGILLKVNASDDYSITSAKATFIESSEEKTRFSLPHQGALLKADIPLKFEELEMLESVSVSVSDHLGTTMRQVDLNKYKEQVKTDQELMNQAGENIESLAEENKENPNEQKQNSKKTATKKKAQELEKSVKELSKRDSIQYQRLEELSEEIMKLVEELDQELPESRKEMKKKKLEETIKELEKEWMILQTIEQLKTLEDSLKSSEKAIDEEQMKELQQSAKELEEKSKEDARSENVEWKKFDNIEKKNEELKKPSDSSGEKESNDEKSEESKPGEQSDKKSPKSPKEEMQEDSESLREQLSQMSDIMMMEATQKNIELIRRLELRSLKSSHKQEEVYKNIVAQSEVDRRSSILQREITQSAKSILDSLSSLTVSDPMLAKALMDNQKSLDEHIVETQNLDPADFSSFVSSQRYLQYGLNDLAAVLYDILKAESLSLMNSKGGSKQCNNPKPGKGKKPSLSGKQKQLGEKLGNMPKPGKGKPGKQTMGQGELLEIIKGQEQILEQYKQEGGSKAGEGKLAEEMNKQLDDLINMNIDKALERNKNIEDKLIALEKSENQKNDQEEKRESQENKLDYKSIKDSALEEYLRVNQKGTSIVNLPALKNYFTGKWVTINQE